MKSVEFELIWGMWGEWEGIILEYVDCRFEIGFVIGEFEMFVLGCIKVFVVVVIEVVFFLLEVDRLFIAEFIFLRLGWNEWFLVWFFDLWFFVIFMLLDIFFCCIRDCCGGNGCFWGFCCCWECWI